MDGTFRTFAPDRHMSPSDVRFPGLHPPGSLSVGYMPNTLNISMTLLSELGTSWP